MPVLVLVATGATIPDVVTFVVSAAVVLVGAVGVVTSRNPVHAALSLVMTLFGVAVLFVEQHADFLAAVQVIVYAGAIVVLFLFVIMFLGVDRREDLRAEPLRGPAPAGRRADRRRRSAAVIALASTPTGSPAPTRWPGRPPHGRPHQRRPARQVGLHHLPVRLRGHGRPAGHRRGRRGGAGPPAAWREPAGERRARSTDEPSRPADPAAACGGSASPSRSSRATRRGGAR